MEDSRPSLQSMLDTLQAALIAPTRSAAQLPSPSDLSFERTLSRSLARNLDTEATKILSIAQSLLNWTTASTDARIELDSDLIKDGEYSQLTLSVEQLLEHADEQVEKHLGLGKHKKSTGPGAVGAKSFEEMEERNKLKQKVERLPARLLHDSTLPKPQLLFTPRTKVLPPTTNDDEEEEEENGEVPLWKPILETKLNPLNPDSAEGWLQTELYEPTSRFSSITNTNPPSYSRYVHPYKLELENVEPPMILLEVPSDSPRSIPADSFEKTPFSWVGTEEALEEMVNEIREVGKEGFKELAIDLEHHDFRSWSGFTCLIQLSTRKKDYVIDTIDPKVRDSLEVLNEFFTDPTWIKVLHGANSDIVWLQRDFGLYIVGLFDTYHATHVLGHAQHSLASLLDMYTNFEPDKRYQLADWRIRPLPKEMLHYARSDTHYLLTIYDHLRIALSKKHSSPSSSSSSSSPSDQVSPLSEVFNRSIQVSSTVFSLAPYDDETGHFDSGFLIPLSKSGQLKAYSTALSIPTLPIKTGWGPREIRFELLRSVMKWREFVARKEDESTRYVVGVQGVLQLVEQYKRVLNGGNVELIRVLGGVRGGVSEVVRRRKDELVEVVRKTVEKYEGGNRGTGDEMELDGDAGTSQEGLLRLMNGLPSFEPVVKPVKGLWDEDATEGLRLPVASTSNSSFFGGNSTKNVISSPSSNSLKAPTSSFFGTSSTQGGKGKGKGTNNGKGKEVVRVSEDERLAAVKKVHDSLVLGGGLAKSLQPHSLPTADTPSATTAAPPSASTPQGSDPSLPVALPVPDASFVAFDSPSSTSKALGSTSHAQSAPKPKDTDVIVVSSLKDKPSRSSQAQAKKRRRAGTEVEASTTSAIPIASGSTTTAGTAAEGAVSPPPQPPQAKKQKKKKSTTSNEPVEPIVPHDYTGSTSILDAGPAILTGLERRDADKKQKKKDKIAQGGKTKGFKVDTSEFKRPMRVDNAPKKANKSQSFLS
ncbi:hypothetical protein JCM16303_005955 [Sporobolomyces ruberrimus]